MTKPAAKAMPPVGVPAGRLTGIVSMPRSYWTGSTGLLVLIRGDLQTRREDTKLTNRAGNRILSAMTWNRLLIVLLALFGLVGQTAVYAMAPVAAPAVASVDVAAPSMDCAGMTMPDGETMPCEGITLDCIADMGCIAPPALAASAELSSHPLIYERAAYEVLRSSLAGLTISPEIFPPNS